MTGHPDEDVIGGVNPVLEALRARGRSVRRVYLSKGRSGPVVKDIMALAKAAGVRVQKVERDRLDRLFGGHGHQGVVAQVDPYTYRDLEDILDRTAGPLALILVLDGVQDPMNLGALIRSAEAAGAAGLVVSREKSAPVNAAAMKASAGAAEHLPVARVVNLTRTLNELKTAGFWVVGTDAAAETGIFETSLPERTALVVGGEGRGLRRLVRETCDLLVAIPLKGRVSSLNASVAGAIAMFEYVRQTEGRAG